MELSLEHLSALFLALPPVIAGVRAFRRVRAWRRVFEKMVVWAGVALLAVPASAAAVMVLQVAVLFWIIPAGVCVAALFWPAQDFAADSPLNND